MEEHLLLCAWCQDRLDKLEPDARLIRAALTVEPVPDARPGWFAGFRPRLLSVASGIAIAIVGAFLFIHPKPGVVTIATLQLTAVRGDVPAIGLAGETDLSLADTPSQGQLRVEVVDQSGTVVWKGSGPGGSVKIAKQLAPGAFFVRLYDNSGALLHEYGFRVHG